MKSKKTLEREIIETSIEIRQFQLKPEGEVMMYDPIDYAGTIGRWKGLVDELLARRGEKPASDTLGSITLV